MSVFSNLGEEEGTKLGGSFRNREKKKRHAALFEHSNSQPGMQSHVVVRWKELDNR